MSDWEDIAIGAPAAAVEPTQITIGLSDRQPDTLNDNDSGWEDVAVGPMAPASDLGAIRNSLVKGLGATLGVADLVVGAPLRFAGLKTPSFQEDYTRLATDAGLLDSSKPASQIGRFAENVAENATAAAPFGPLAMAMNAVLGGTGGYLGESVGSAVGSPEIGRAAGSFLGGVSPAAISKLGIAKEIGEQLGPVASKIPLLSRVLGDAPIESAVGRALTKTASNADEAEAALRAANQVMGPQTQLQALKTTAEIAGDPGLARATDAVENLYSGAGFKQIGDERAAVRAATATKDMVPGVQNWDLSKNLEESLGKSNTVQRAVEKATWDAVPKTELVDIRLSGLDDILDSKITQITMDGALPLEGEAAALLTSFKKAQAATDEGVLNIGVLQDLRSNALRVGRSTASRTSQADRAANDVANALASHIDDILDANVAARTLTPDSIELLKGARSLTKERIQTFAAPKPGTENAGTKGLEMIGIKGGSLVDDALLKEGLNSPDKLAAQLQAAAKGGQDVRPIYKQALQAELEKLPQSKWEKAINEKRIQWEMVHSPEEMRAIQNTLDDIAQETGTARSGFTTNSQTNPRGNVQKALMSEKGIARLGSGSELAGLAQAGTTIGAATTGAGIGADIGGEYLGTPGAILGGILGGLGGVVGGKAFNKATEKASGRFDQLLIQALKDPREAARLMNAAKPSQFGKLLSQALKDAAKTGAIKAGSNLAATGANKAASSILQPSITQPAITEQTQEVPDMPLPKRLFKNISSSGIDANELDPIDLAQINAESSGRKLAVGPETKYGTAKGLMQLLDGTGVEWHKKLGLEGKYDPFNAKQNLAIGKAYREFLTNRYDGDVRLGLAAYNWGLGNLDKALAKTKSGTFEEVFTLMPAETRNYVTKIMSDVNGGVVSA